MKCNILCFSVDGYLVLSKECRDRIHASTVDGAGTLCPPFFEDQIMIGIGCWRRSPVTLIERCYRYPVSTFPKSPHQYSFDCWMRKTNLVVINHFLCFQLLFCGCH